jgi:hypothetical protein
VKAPLSGAIVYTVRRQFTAHNSLRTAEQYNAGTIHHEKIKIPLDEFLILLD